MPRVGNNGTSDAQLAELDAGGRIKMKNCIKPEKFVDATFTD